ncbi:hypothetical protein EVAR_7148_1 [Eumeta japonica]|uniref:Uncharacterized protein n=1 Tax=Eumeta variegata TaxID=151549 RepID=A0A4C1U6F1_EUMVA|nr:hypothetical protein EVAR_7148_1 [Eumeta japonica]
MSRPASCAQERYGFVTRKCDPIAKIYPATIPFSYWNDWEVWDLKLSKLIQCGLGIDESARTHKRRKWDVPKNTILGVYADPHVEYRFRVVFRMRARGRGVDVAVFPRVFTVGFDEAPAGVPG